MALVELVPMRTWEGVTGPMGPVTVQRNVDSIDVHVFPDEADWLLDASVPFEERRVVIVTIEQSVDGVTWGHWGGATFITGFIPRQGKWQFGITDGDGLRNHARLFVTVSHSTVRFSLSAELSRRRGR